MSAMNLTLRELAGWLSDARLVGDGAVRCARVHTCWSTETTCRSEGACPMMLCHPLLGRSFVCRY
jgi:hypothetical protein